MTREFSFGKDDGVSRTKKDEERDKDDHSKCNGRYLPDSGGKDEESSRRTERPGEIEVLVDNETAVKNVTKMAKSSGASAESEQLGEKQYRVLITVGEAAAGQLKSAHKSDAQPQTAPDAAAECRTCVGTVVAVGSDRMGEGSEELAIFL